MRSVLSGIAAVLLLAVAPATVMSVSHHDASAAHHRAPRPEAVVRAGSPWSTSFTSSGGQGLLDLTVWAPGVDWGRVHDESAVASVAVDGTTQTVLLVPGEDPTARELALGDLTPGSHTLTLTFEPGQSAPQARQVAVRDVAPRTVPAGDPAYVALAHAPVVYGRSLAAYGGPTQNAWTDAPLVGWHDATTNPDGTTSLEYQMVWSNEDGGTDTEPPSEQARWGRMTDIEWIYRVTVDAQGHTVAGSETFQSANHGTGQFSGRHEGDHPVLQTCTDNNNMCDQVSDAQMRFFLSYAPTLDPTGQAREQIMDEFPWTYAVMGEEMVREEHTERRGDPATAELSDARDYLYVVIDKTTSNPTANAASPWVGVSVAVQLRGSHRWYRSDHDVPAWSLQRDGQDATDVELPPGTSRADIARIAVVRFPTSVRADPGYTATVTSMNRAYLLGRDYAPQQPFLRWHGSVTLTPQHPTAVIWQR